MLSFGKKLRIHSSGFRIFPEFGIPLQKMQTRKSVEYYHISKERGLGFNIELEGGNLLKTQFENLRDVK